MTRQDDKIFAAKIIAMASGVRRVVMFGNQRIDDEINKSEYDDYELEPLLEFTNLLMQGYDTQYIVDRLQITPELESKIAEMFDIYEW